MRTNTAVTDRKRVGEGLELLKNGLAPYVAREFKNAYKEGVGRDAGRIADEVSAHLAGLVGSTVKVTLEIEAEVEAGAPEQVIGTVTENSRSLKFTTHGFEQD